MILVGIEDADGDEDITFLTKKVVNMRIFDDAEGVMNRSVLDIDGEILVVSQFTLHASTKKGNRPSYIKAAKPDISVPLYEKFCAELSLALGKPVKTGVFGADMQCALINDGPVTIFMDSKNKEWWDLKKENILLFFFFISTFAHVIEWRYFTWIINVFFDNKGVIEHTLNDGFTVRVWQYVPTEVRQPLVQYSSLGKTYWAYYP